MDDRMIFEVHLTYACDLRCRYCNRASSLCPTHTPDLTIDQWIGVLRGLPDIMKIKRAQVKATFTGGEPTLRDVEAFIEASLAEFPLCKFAIESNAATPQRREQLDRFWRKWHVVNVGGPKPGGVPTYSFVETIYLSPLDAGQTDVDSCNWANQCGLSVDGGGMTVCPIGGMIDGVLGLGIRTWNWHELTQERLLRLCAHCGRARTRTAPTRQPDLFTVRGHQMTAEWRDGFARHGVV
jgi:hypothetical protein